jgi:hypothetical protein
MAYESISKVKKQENHIEKQGVAVLDIVNYYHFVEPVDIFLYFFQT